MLSAILSALFFIFIIVFGSTVPGLIIGLLIGYLLSWSLRFTRRVSNDAFFGAAGFALGSLGSIFHAVVYGQWDLTYADAFGAAGAILLTLLHELYLFSRRRRNQTTAA